MKINKIKVICDACWLNQRELSGLTGIAEQRFKDISSGRVAGLKDSDIAILVDKLHLNPEWLATGNGDVFKQGFSRSYPSRGEFVADVLNRMVKLVDPIQYQPVIDQVLELQAGTAIAWIKQGKIPYWYLQKFADKHALQIDTLIYGFSVNLVQAHSYEPRREAQINLQQESAAYNNLSKRERALLDDFRALGDKEKDAAETMLHAVAQSKVKKA